MCSLSMQLKLVKTTNWYSACLDFLQSSHRMTRFMELDIFCSPIDAVTCDIHIFLGICALTFTFFLFFCVCVLVTFVSLHWFSCLKITSSFAFIAALLSEVKMGKLQELLKSALLWTPLVGLHLWNPPEYILISMDPAWWMATLGK